MLYYPQISTGASGQYPIQRVRVERTIVNTLEDGSRVVLGDPGASTIRWEISYAGLTDDEAQALSAFFASIEGRLSPFTFFDPVGNLLGWSEALDQPAWQRSTLLTLQAGIDDPLGTTRATAVTNSGAGGLSLAQEISVPGAVTCCWSFYARTPSPDNIQITRESGGDGMSAIASIGPSWQRFTLAGSLSAGADSSVFGISLSAGVTIDLFGCQVDAQPGPSQYVRTPANGGVYPSARFDNDTLTITATSLNQNQCSVSIITPVTG